MASGLHVTPAVGKMGIGKLTSSFPGLEACAKKSSSRSNVVASMVAQYNAREGGKSILRACSGTSPLAGAPGAPTTEGLLDWEELDDGGGAVITHGVTLELSYSRLSVYQRMAAAR